MKSMFQIVSNNILKDQGNTRNRDKAIWRNQLALMCHVAQSYMNHMALRLGYSNLNITDSF